MQYETIPVSRPDINQSDISSVTKAMEAIEISGHSSYVGIFEDLLKEYLEVQNVITVSNGSDAIDLVIDSLNLEKGDEFWCSF